MCHYDYIISCGLLEYLSNSKLLCNMQHADEFMVYLYTLHSHHFSQTGFSIIIIYLKLLVGKSCISMEAYIHPCIHAVHTSIVVHTYTHTSSILTTISRFSVYLLSIFQFIYPFNLIHHIQPHITSHHITFPAHAYLPT